MKQGMAAGNKRFCKMAAVPPQTILYEIQRLSPAASVVKPPPRKAAGTLPASVGSAIGKRKKRCKIQKFRKI